MTRGPFSHGIDVASGAADARAIVCEGDVRFTVLTPTLLRLEYDPDRRFEDRPSFFALHRRQPVPDYQVERRDGQLHIRTRRLLLRYRLGTGFFTAKNLDIEVRKAGSRRARPADSVFWKPGDTNRRNLGGTVRTLDNCRGTMRLDDGLLSRDGWFLMDDTWTPVFTTDWIEARLGEGRRDWYFFGYAQDYRQALRDLVTLSGAIPVPPAYVFGSWYSRYWRYTAADFKRLVEEYASQGFPLDVLVMDMDWHKPGWTGYSWNRELIPDPEELLRFLHTRGIAVTLNLHPASGVHPHEDAYEAFARAMGVDPASRQPIPFDCTDPRFMRNYFELLHHPLERQGVDFWWLDWQQQRCSAIARLDPLTWLNHLHFHHRHPGDRLSSAAADAPAIFSRWGGWGSQRYPIQFSGDAESSWEVLQFQVRLTPTAGNVGCVYWSHDLGGHWCLSGRTDPELLVRWLQFGAVSPVFRVHSTNDPLNDRRPWLDGEPYASAARKACLLRRALLPHLLALAEECHDSGIPLCRPMYLEYPDVEEAYQADGQYLLGDLLVVPLAEPGGGAERMARADCWLPAGTWVEWETGRAYRGPAKLTFEVALDALLVFHRPGRGALLPEALRRPHGVRCLDPGPEPEQGAASGGHVRTARVHPSGSGASAQWLDDWIFAGPFRPQGDRPEVREALRVALAGKPAEGSWLGPDGLRYEWRRYRTLASTVPDRSQRLNHAVNMKVVFGEIESIGLAVATLDLPGTAEVCLCLRHDDPLRLWVAGVEIYSRDTVRPLYDPPVCLRTRLGPGADRVVVVQKQFGDRWGFEIQVCPAAH